MRNLLFSSTITMAPPSASLSKPSKKPSSYPNHPFPTATTSYSSSSLLCRHSPSAILDILILILVFFSGTFLISSYFSYVFHSLFLLLPHLSFTTVFAIVLDYPYQYYLSFLLFFVLAVLFSKVCFDRLRRRCRRVGCKGLRKAMEFDLQMQSEECLRSGDKAVKEIDDLPWKGGHEGNPDYECLRAELRKMAPPNGRAVLLFMARCGCPVAKLEGWGAKRGRQHKKEKKGV